jgi:hypothetical protein
VIENARHVAIDHLEKALRVAEGDIAKDVQDALAQTNTIRPSPLFSKKGII